MSIKPSSSLDDAFSHLCALVDKDGIDQFCDEIDEKRIDDYLDVRKFLRADDPEETNGTVIRLQNFGLFECLTKATNRKNQVTQAWGNLGRLDAERKFTQWPNLLMAHSYAENQLSSLVQKLERTLQIAWEDQHKRNIGSEIKAVQREAMNLDSLMLQAIPTTADWLVFGMGLEFPRHSQDERVFDPEIIRRSVRVWSSQVDSIDCQLREITDAADDLQTRLTSSRPLVLRFGSNWASAGSGTEEHGDALQCLVLLGSIRSSALFLRSLVHDVRGYIRSIVNMITRINTLLPSIPSLARNRPDVLTSLRLNHHYHDLLQLATQLPSRNIPPECLQSKSEKLLEYAHAVQTLMQSFISALDMDKMKWHVGIIVESLPVARQ